MRPRFRDYATDLGYVNVRQATRASGADGENLEGGLYMADDGEHHGGGSPVWERRGRRGGGGSNPLVGLIVTLLALFGALTAGLGIAKQSVAEGGEQIDAWITSGWDMVRGVDAEDVADAAGEAAAATGEAAETAGDAVEAGADAASEELKGG